MLSEDEKRALREEEVFRKSVRDEIETRKPRLLNAENLKWLSTTIAIPLAVWIATSNHEKSQTAIAEGRKEIDQLTALLPELSHNDPTAVSVLSIMVKVPTASDTVKELYKSISAKTFVQQQQASADPIKAEAAAANREILIQNSPAPPRAPSAEVNLTSASAVLPPQTAPALASAITPQTYVYTQIYWEGQRANANALSTALRKQGVPVLGVQNVMTGRTAQQLQYAQRGAVDVRFYHSEDKAAALALVPVIRSVAPGFGEPTVHDLSARSAQGKLGTLEVWYPCAAKAAPCAPDAGALDFSDPKNSGLLPSL